MMHSVIPPDKKEWLLKTGWKKMTIQQIALELSVNVHTINQFLSRHGIEPMRKRDLVASKLLDIYNNSEDPPKTPRGYALLLDSSEAMIKDIIKDYGLDIKARGYKDNKPVTDRDIKLKAIKEYDERIAEIRSCRSAFTAYTQSGSNLTDEVRQINTTLRPKTYLTNA